MSVYAESALEHF